MLWLEYGLQWVGLEDFDDAGGKVSIGARCCRRCAKLSDEFHAPVRDDLLSSLDGLLDET